MIGKATYLDLNVIKRLTEACALEMEQRGIFQWNESYPAIDVLKRDIEREELFVLRDRGHIVGIIVLTTEMDEEYFPVKWLTSENKSLYVHRLATHPSVWGLGFGQELMNFAENRAYREGFQSIRLDTFSQNQRNQKFYESRGYQRLGNIYFPRQSKAPFYCYEKIIG